MTLLDAIPTARHRGADELPWVNIGGDSFMKVLQVRVEEGLWVVLSRFGPGYTVQTHKHTGQVYAYTISGAWAYRESDFVNRAGSYLFEPAGSVGYEKGGGLGSMPRSVKDTDSNVAHIKFIAFANR